MKQEKLKDKLKELNFTKEEEFKIELANEQQLQLTGMIDKLRMAINR